MRNMTWITTKPQTFTIVDVDYNPKIDGGMTINHEQRFFNMEWRHAWNISSELNQVELCTRTVKPFAWRRSVWSRCSRDIRNTAWRLSKNWSLGMFQSSKTTVVFEKMSNMHVCRCHTQIEYAVYTCLAANYIPAFASTCAFPFIHVLLGTWHSTGETIGERFVGHWMPMVSWFIFSSFFDTVLKKCKGLNGLQGFLRLIRLTGTQVGLQSMLQGEKTHAQTAICITHEMNPRLPI